MNPNYVFAYRLPGISVLSAKLEDRPVQNNKTDCGLFLLAFTESFCHEAPDRMHAEYVKLLAECDGGLLIEQGDDVCQQTESVGWIDAIQYLHHECFLQFNNVR